MLRTFLLLLICAMFLAVNGQDTIVRKDGIIFAGKVYDINAKYVKLIEPKTYLHKRVLREEIDTISFTRPGCSFDEKGRLYIERKDSCALSESQIYQNTSLWFARTFIEMEILSVDEQEAGLISRRIKDQLDCTITVQFREQKYRILVDNLTIRSRDISVMGACYDIYIRDLDPYMIEDYYSEAGTVEAWGTTMEQRINDIHVHLDELESVLQQSFNSKDW